MTDSEEPSMRVAISDFPIYDGLTDPEAFLRQCNRLAVLGGIDEGQLAAIVAVRCRGLALQAVEANPGEDVCALLRRIFPSRTAASAATELSSLRKDGPVLPYALRIQQLVREACPEFFDQSGAVKRTCASSHEAALFRHFLVGLPDEDKLILSRQGATTFTAAVKELVREEEVTTTSQSPKVSFAVQLENRPCSPRQDHAHPDAGYPPASSEDWRRRRSSSPGPIGGRSAHDRPRPPSRSGSRSPGRWREGNDRQRRAPGGPELRHDWRGQRRQRPAGPPTSSRVWTPSSGGDSRGDGADQTARPRQQDEFEVEGRRSGMVRCWSCGGAGHMKRHCPNAWLGGHVW